MYVFNGDLSQPQHEGLNSRLRKLFTSPVLTACFGSVSVVSARLSDVEDVYDKRRLHANWTVGPNRLFDFAVATAAAQGYAFMMQIELDMVPIRRLWLEKLQCLARNEASWVIGSPLLAPCSHDSHTGRCSVLGDHIKFHINGNALCVCRGTWALPSSLSQAAVGQGLSGQRVASMRALGIASAPLSRHCTSAAARDYGAARG